MSDYSAPSFRWRSRATHSLALGSGQRRSAGSWAVFIFVAVAWPTAARSTEAADPATYRRVLGLELGVTLTAPECPTEILVRDIPVYSSEFDSAQLPCWKHFGPHRPRTPLPSPAQVMFHFDAKPDGIVAVVGLVVEGKLERLRAVTRGHSVQNQVRHLLMEKFGTPTVTMEHPVRNGMGESFENFRATWKLNGLTVRFEGITDQVNSGQFVIETPSGAGHEAERVRAEEANRPKL